MNFDEYQSFAVSTSVYPENYKVIYPTLGLCGEAGEVSEKVKKIVRDGKGNFDDPVKKQEILSEMGDVLWYLANLANDLGYNLSEVGDCNVHKLLDRIKRDVVHGSGDSR